jgi:hypothetical protein
MMGGVREWVRELLRETRRMREIIRRRRKMGMKEGAVQRFPRRGRGGMAWLSMVHPRPRPRPRMHPRMKGRRWERGTSSGVSD